MHMYNTIHAHVDMVYACVRAPVRTCCTRACVACGDPYIVCVCVSAIVQPAEALVGTYLYLLTYTYLPIPTYLYLLTC